MAVCPPFPREGLPASAGTILIVDYHPEIATLAKTALSRAGFEVLTARDGEQALTLVEAQPHLDVVLTEALLPPPISGAEVVAGIKKSSASTTVMYITGDSDQPLDPKIPLLKKPFRASMLVRRVQAVFEERRRAAEQLEKSWQSFKKPSEMSVQLMSDLASSVSVLQHNLAQVELLPPPAEGPVIELGLQLPHVPVQLDELVDARFEHTTRPGCLEEELLKEVRAAGEQYRAASMVYKQAIIDSEHVGWKLDAEAIYALQAKGRAAHQACKRYFAAVQECWDARPRPPSERY